jgi:NAD(P)-dependent dehydrogenase (short-subunit alcohol dehydrogenase family)
MQNIFDLSGCVALVTGASSGLGEHFAQVLAAAGAKVVVAARRVAIDVTDPASVASGFNDAERAFGALDILINNAGVAKPTVFLKSSEEDWDFVMQTNLKAAWRVAREFSERLVAVGKPGSIVNIGSVLGLGVGYGETLYSISKAGIVQLTKNMALELMRNQIRVNALCPGYFETEINADYFKSERGQTYITKNIPSKRLGQLDELTGPLLLLASGAGSFVNGVALAVDGGHLVHSL